LHVQQPGDFFIRNVIYEHLIQNTWPLTLPDGHWFIYYLAYWLPPAFLSSLLPEIYTSWVLLLWTFCGLELMLLIVMSRWGCKKTTCWFMILMCFGSLIRTAGEFGIMNRIYPDYRAVMVLFSNVPMQIFNTFHHAVPALLCMGMLLTRSLPAVGYFFIGALLLPTSPLASLVFLPFMIYEGLFRQIQRPDNLLKRLKTIISSPVFIISCLFVLLSTLFYHHLAEGSRFSCLFTQAYGESFDFDNQVMTQIPVSVKYSSFFLSLTFGVLLPALMLFPYCRRSPLYTLSFTLMFCVLFFKIGLLSNELLFKAPAVLYPVLALLFYRAFSQTKRSWIRIAFILYLALTALSPMKYITKQALTFQRDPILMQQSKRTGGEEILQHPERTPYNKLIHDQFAGKEGKPGLDWLFKTPTCRWGETHPSHTGDL
jgi:hypothetical protein